MCLCGSASACSLCGEMIDGEPQALFESDGSFPSHLLLRLAAVEHAETNVARTFGGAYDVNVPSNDLGQGLVKRIDRDLLTGGDTVRLALTLA